MKHAPICRSALIEFYSIGCSFHFSDLTHAVFIVSPSVAMPSSVAQYHISFVAGNLSGTRGAAASAPLPVSQSSAAVAAPNQPAIVVSPAVPAQRSDPFEPTPRQAPARPTPSQPPRSIRDVRSRGPDRRSLSPPPGCCDVPVPPLDAVSGQPTQEPFNVFTPMYPGLRPVPNRNFVSAAHTQMNRSCLQV